MVSSITLISMAIRYLHDSYGNHGNHPDYYGNKVYPWLQWQAWQSPRLLLQQGISMVVMVTVAITLIIWKQGISMVAMEIDMLPNACFTTLG